MMMQFSRIALVVTFLLISLSSVASGQDKTPPEAFSAVAVGTGGSVGGKTISFDFRVSNRLIAFLISAR
jgi:hypothetical protein